MLKDEINERYFNWLCRRVSGDKIRRRSYRKLLRKLHETDFTYSVGSDGNRADDGVNLRYAFGDEKGMEQCIVALYLDIRPCSVLEMMAALAIRCETHIMGEPEIGDRPGRWFEKMIFNLGLGDMYDTKYDENTVNDILERFLDRDYDRDGKGGLFTVKNCAHDMRTAEIWYQMMYYLNDILKDQTRKR